MTASWAFRRILFASTSALVILAALLAPTALSSTPAAEAAVGDGPYGCDYNRSNKRVVKVHNDQEMQEAVKNRRGGDRILVMNDGYYSQLPIFQGSGGWDGNWITVAAAPGKQPKIAGEAWAAVDIREPYVQVCGFEIFGTSSATNWNDTTRVGVSVGATHHVRIADNFIHNFSLSGINMNFSNNLEVVGNTVKWNSFWGIEQGSGISVWQPNDAIGSLGTSEGKYQIQIAGNIVSGNANRRVSDEYRDDNGNLAATDGNGIILDDFEQLQVPSHQRNAYDGWALVANNVVSKNGGRGIHTGPNGGRRIHIINNTAYHNLQSVREGKVNYDNFGRAEITMFGTQHQTAWEMRLVNNIAIVDPALTGDRSNVMAFYRGNIPDGTITSHNNAFSGRTVKGTFNYPGMANSEAKHELGPSSRNNVNPPFKNPAQGNFQLTNKWLAGSSDYNGTVGYVDLDGRSRGQRQEIGAYEFHDDGEAKKKAEEEEKAKKEKEKREKEKREKEKREKEKEEQAKKTVFCGGLEATIVGTDKNDVLKGTKGDDVIAGLGGNDVISGSGGNDVICGGTGRDKIKGDGGSDTLYGGSGRDNLSGGGGKDVLDGGTGKDVCNGGKGRDRAVNCEKKQKI